MPKKVYRLEAGSMQDRFQNSRNKIQIVGGGFGNGKTTALVIKALRVARDYPGANILLGRATYPKLIDTLLKAFFDWCPAGWIEDYSKTTHTVKLKNATTINFRYIQQKQDNEQSSSNLLSATYDFIGIDQMEDPEIVYKDFLDMLGRLRGDTPYQGDDPTMPPSGPRWLVMTCNPARNWLFKHLVRPLYLYQQTGRITEDLIVDDDGRILLDLFEGSTFENSDNLAKDFLQTLTASYTGQMRDRFLLGKWAAYEGLVYPQFVDNIHMIEHQLVVNYYNKLLGENREPSIIEAYDYGLAVPSCYLLAYTDTDGNVIVLDGFYRPEASPEWQASEMRALRRAYNIIPEQPVLADPDIMRRKPGTGTATVRVVDLFAEQGIRMQAASNDIMAGITKVQSYLVVRQMHRNPFTRLYGSPRLFFSDKLSFISNEIAEYYWKKQDDVMIDRPVDKNDHAMDAIKYMLSRRPRIAGPVIHRAQRFARLTSTWTERNVAQPDERNHRYA